MRLGVASPERCMGSPGAPPACRPVLREDPPRDQMMKWNEIACWNCSAIRPTCIPTNTSSGCLYVAVLLTERWAARQSVEVGLVGPACTGVWVRMERWGRGIPLTLCTAGDTAALLSWQQQQSPPPAWACNAQARRSHTQWEHDTRTENYTNDTNTVCVVCVDVCGRNICKTNTTRGVRYLGLTWSPINYRYNICSLFKMQVFPLFPPFLWTDGALLKI